MQSTTVKLNVTHSKRAMKAMELRFNTASTIAVVKNNLEMRFGTSASFMILKLFDETGQLVCSMLDNDSTLGSFNPQDYYTIHIIDLDPSTVNLDNLEDVPKYTISEEAYNALDVNVRKFKEEKMKTHPDLMKPNNPPIDDDYQLEEAKEIQVGQRCKVCIGDKRGVVRYVGKVPSFKLGWFVGVELDEFQGKNDGTHGGVRYFETLPNKGVFVRPAAIEIGNFQPLSDDPDEL
jgi:tubulin-specific chaperone B